MTSEIQRGLKLYDETHKVISLFETKKYLYIWRELWLRNL